MSINQDDGHERETPLNLKGPLKAFLGTPIESLIGESLKNAGIEPWQYDLEKAGHINFHGLPATQPGLYDGPQELSPIVEAVYSRLEDGSLISRPPEPDTVRINRSRPGSGPVDGNNAHLLSRLSEIGLEGLYDADSGEAVAYSVLTSSEGGRPGYVLISTNDVEMLPRAGE